VSSILKSNHYEGLEPAKSLKEIMGSDKKSLFAQLEDNGIEYRKPSPEIDASMKDFFEKIGVTYKPTHEQLGAIAIADLMNRTVEVMEGKSNINTLPEEAAHFYVSMLEESNPLYKKMYNDISNYQIYQDTLTKYKDNEMYQGNEKKLREEAIGKLIADRIVNGVDTSLPLRQQSQVNTWWSKLWEHIKSIFNKTKSDPFTKSAYDILTKNVSELTTYKDNKSDVYNKQDVIETVLSSMGEDAKEIMREELTSIDKDEFNRMVAKAGFNSLGKYWTLSPINKMYQLDKTLEQKWVDIPLTSKGMYKTEYFKSTELANESLAKYKDLVGDENVTLFKMPEDGKYQSKIVIKKPITEGDISEKLFQREDTGVSNMKELAKAPIEFSAEDLNKNFDTFFPDKKYLSTEEKDAYLKAIQRGEETVNCEF
jgi:hypothetical protein